MSGIITYLLCDGLRSILIGVPIFLLPKTTYLGTVQIVFATKITLFRILPKADLRPRI
jgi:hypothetical protein